MFVDLSCQNANKTFYESRLNTGMRHDGGRNDSDIKKLKQRKEFISCNFFTSWINKIGVHF